MEERTGCRKRLASILAGMLVVLIVFTFPLALLAQSVEAGLFSSDTLTALIEARLISTGFIHDLITRTVFEAEAIAGVRIAGVGLDDAFANLSADDKQEIVERLLPEDWLRSQVESFLEHTLAWLESDKTQPDWFIDLAPMRDNLIRGGGAASTAEIMIASWPECSPEEARALTAYISEGGPPTALCEPSDPLRYQLIDEATRYFRQIAEDIPLQLQIGEQVLSESNPERIRALKNSVQALRRLATASMLLPWIFLGLIMALVIRSSSSLLRWWGGVLGLGGVFGLLIASRLSNLQGGQISSAILDLERQSPELAQAVSDISGGIISGMLESFALSSLLWAIFGAGAFFVGMLIKRGFRLSLRREDAQVAAGRLEEQRTRTEQELTHPPAIEPLNGMPSLEDPPDPPSGIYG
ncbi:MAG: hypothetical protein JXA97_08790 [Anaerolineales bacterium]|nr:hypothetical protein [Anaerolineales bacterium]